MTDRNELFWSHAIDMEDYEGAKAIAHHAIQEMAQHKTVEELSQEATQRFGDKNASFEECLTLLAIAQEAASSEGDHLSAKNATCLGDALVVAGHDLYNGGYDGGGRGKFVEATEMFTYAIAKDPYSIKSYLGLSDMQAELESTPATIDSPNPYPRASQTMTLLEEKLQEKPELDTVDARLDIAILYRRLRSRELAVNSFAMAIEKSVEEPASRVRILNELSAFLSVFRGKEGLEEAKAACMENLSRATRRVLIQDPNDRIYTRLAYVMGIIGLPKEPRP